MFLVSVFCNLIVRSINDCSFLLTPNELLYFCTGNLNLNGVGATLNNETISNTCNNSTTVDQQNSLNAQNHQSNLENNNNMLDTYNRELSKNASSLLETDSDRFDSLENQKILNCASENAKFVHTRRINRSNVIQQDPAEEMFSSQKSQYSLGSQKLMDDDEISALFGSSRDSPMNAPSATRMSSHSNSATSGGGNSCITSSMMGRRFSDENMSSRMSPALVSPTAKFKSSDAHSLSFTNASAVPSPFLDEAPG